MCRTGRIGVRIVVNCYIQTPAITVENADPALNSSGRSEGSSGRRLCWVGVQTLSEGLLPATACHRAWRAFSRARKHGFRPRRRQCGSFGPSGKGIPLWHGSFPARSGRRKRDHPRDRLRACEPPARTKRTRSAYGPEPIASTVLNRQVVRRCRLSSAIRQPCYWCSAKTLRSWSKKYRLRMPLGCCRRGNRDLGVQGMPFHRVLMSGWGPEARVPGPLHCPASSPDSVSQHALKLASSHAQEREAQCNRCRVSRKICDCPSLTQSKSGRCVHLW